MPETPLDLELTHDTYHQGDSYPAFEATVVDAGGDTVDLSDAHRGRLKLGRRTTHLDTAVRLGDGGTVTYDWSSDDLDVPAGVYDVTVVIRLPDGTLTAPTNRAASLTIRRSL